MRIDVPYDQGHDPYGYASRTLAPDIMGAAAGFSQATYRHSQLSLREFEAARARTAEINGCFICQNFRAARDLPALLTGQGVDCAGTIAERGETPDEAFYAGVAEWRTSPLYSAREKLAIAFAERFAEEPKLLARDEGFWEQMRDAFTDAEIVDLAHCVAGWVGLGRVAHVLGFDTVCLPGVPVKDAA